MKVLMLVQSNVAKDMRVLREATALSEAGYDVQVVGRDVSEDFVAGAGLEVISVPSTLGLRRDTASLGSLRRVPPHVSAARWMLLPEHRARVEASWVRGARPVTARLRPDIVHAHDYNTLALGAEIAERVGATLVYDSHELWLGRPRLHRPTPVRSFRERRLEARLGSRADVVITVGEGVAGALRKDYGWDHIVIVRNTFETLPPDAEPLLPDIPRGLVYAGRIAAYRDLDTLLEAQRRLVPLEVILAGPRDQAFMAARSWDGVTVHESLPQDGVDRLLRSAGLALVSHSTRWENHRLALPNKLFHAIRAGVPVVAADAPELARVVSSYDIGELYRPGDVDGLVRAVERALHRYAALLKRVADAAPELSWSRDRPALLDVYARLAAGRRVGGTRS